MTTADPRAGVQDFLRRHGLLHDGEPVQLDPLTGGVSSDLWKVDLPGRTLCVKGALAQLKVEKQWRAPTSRNRVEYQWLQFAGAVAPGQVPQVLAQDEQAGLFAMQYLPPQDHPVWKTQLLAGKVHPQDAAAVGDLVGRLHAASAADPTTKVTFATDDNFDALRIDPYFRVTARANPDLADRIDELAATTAATHLAVSPRRRQPQEHPARPARAGAAGRRVRLVRRPGVRPRVLPEPPAAQGRGPARPRRRPAPLGTCPARRGTPGTSTGNPPTAFTRRVAALLPLLALARVDGASPVEYLNPAQRQHVRGLARTLLRSPAPTVDEVLNPWMLATGIANTGAAQVKEPTP